LGSDAIKRKRKTPTTGRVMSSAKPIRIVRVFFISSCWYFLSDRRGLMKIPTAPNILNDAENFGMTT